jgi:lysophospholipase L1-like esterase
MSDRLTWGYLVAPLLLAAGSLLLPTDAVALDYVALGDSIAVGAGDDGSGGYPGRYRGYAEADLDAPVLLQNSAVGGSTSGDLLTTLTTDAPLRAAIAAADLVTFDIGGNDILIALFSYSGGTCGGPDGEDCLRAAVIDLESNWPAIVAELRALNPGAMMRTMTYYNPFVAGISPGDGNEGVPKEYLSILNAVVRNGASAGAVAVAEVADAFNGSSGNENPVTKGYIDPDGIHPSPLGHQVVADEFRALGYPPTAGTFIRIPSTVRLRDAVAPALDPSKRKITFKSSTRKGYTPANRIVLPLIGGAQDPTVVGGELVVFNAAGPTTDEVTVILPASGWSVVGTKGFRFESSGPIFRVSVSPDQIKVKGGGAAWDYTLDELSQGAVAVRLTLGNGGWCARAPAAATGAPPSTANSDLPGKFVGAKKAPPPAACAVPGVTTTTTTTVSTTTTSTTTTSTMPSCGGMACTGCGSCVDGICAAAGAPNCGHLEPGGVCVSNSSCSSTTCAVDADCPPAEACIITAGTTYCCAWCP